MFGLDTLDEKNSSPTTPSRLNRDKTNLQKIINPLEMFGIFTRHGVFVSSIRIHLYSITFFDYMYSCVLLFSQSLVNRSQHLPNFIFFF